MKCREFQKLIEAYLAETIEEPQRKRFEEHFFRCRKCFLGLKISETLQRKEVRIPLMERPRQAVFRILKPMLVMSSLFLLILLSVFVLRQQRHSARLQELSHFDLPLYHQGELRGLPDVGTEVEEDFSRAMRHFRSREFRAALDILEQPSLADAGYPKVDFFRAIAYLGQNEAEKAGAILDAIIQDMDPAYFDEALYYKGFVLLRQGRMEAARTQFEKIARMLSPMAGKARVMVQKIDDLS
ncbi:MAG: zf-HC2 domain-containing protein [Candidatus Aminicenantes bacterium]|nr:zf-HC2 domain-containing protein [Candidatus Aminicenantes bacterium]